MYDQPNVRAVKARLELWEKWWWEREGASGGERFSLRAITCSMTHTHPRSFAISSDDASIYMEYLKKYFWKTRKASEMQLGL